MTMRCVHRSQRTGASWSFQITGGARSSSLVLCCSIPPLSRLFETSALVGPAKSRDQRAEFTAVSTSNMSDLTVGVAIQRRRNRYKIVYTCKRREAADVSSCSTSSASQVYYWMSFASRQNSTRRELGGFLFTVFSVGRRVKMRFITPKEHHITASVYGPRIITNRSLYKGLRIMFAVGYLRCQVCHTFSSKHRHPPPRSLTFSRHTYRRWCIWEWVNCACASGWMEKQCSP